MQWKSLDRSTQVWLEINLVSVVTWGWWYRRTITHYQECALEESLLQTYSKWQANGDWFGEGGLLSMYPTCWGFLRSCWSVQIGSSCQLLSVCTQGYGSAPHSAYSNLFLWGPLAFPWLYEACPPPPPPWELIMMSKVEFCPGYFCVGKSGRWVLKLLSISSRPHFHSHSIAQVAACSYELLLCPNSNHLFLHIEGTWMRHDCLWLNNAYYQ